MNVFISYTHASGGEYAIKIADALRKVDVSPWQDADNIRHGASITREVEDGLRASAGAVIIFTHDYLESPGCFMELAYSLARLEVDKSFGIFVVVADGDWSLVRPIQLRDIRLDDMDITNFDGLAREISRRLAPSPARDMQEGTRWPLAAAQFGFLPLRATLAVPVGQEQSFWILHDALRARRIVQTIPAVHRPIVSVAGPEGAGCVELLATYVDLLGGSYEGGIVWLSERGTDEQIRGALRTIGQNLGVAPHQLEPHVLESSLCQALRARPQYLWIVLKGSAPSNR
jgi:TIR domain